MTRTAWLTPVALVASLLAGCEQAPAGPGAADAELARLSHEVHGLFAAVQAAGGLTPALRERQARLDAAIIDWQTSTGRRDISFTVSERAAGDGAVISAVDNIEPGCTKAPATYNPATREYCVLLACDPKSGTASYKCYTLPKTVS